MRACPRNKEQVACGHHDVTRLIKPRWLRRLEMSLGMNQRQRSSAGKKKKPWKVLTSWLVGRDKNMWDKNACEWCVSPIWMVKALCFVCGWTNRCDEHPEWLIMMDKGVDYRGGYISLHSVVPRSSNQTVVRAFPPTRVSKQHDNRPLLCHSLSFSTSCFFTQRYFEVRSLESIMP